MAPESINLQNKFSKVSEYWHPYIVAELNENYVKIARVKGELVWHSHEHEDEMFFILRGTLMLEFPDKTVAVQEGEVLIVPKGVKHRPYTTGDEDVLLMLIEPKSTKHTGDVKVEQTVERLEWI